MDAKLRERYARKIASFIYAECVLHQEMDNHCVEGKAIENCFENLPKDWKKDHQLIADIENELQSYEGTASVETYTAEFEDNDLVFDVVLYTDYIANEYDAE